jgi:hypothetical protein
MVAGTFVGALSDKYGRRNMCIAFAVSYFIAGASKQSKLAFKVLFADILPWLASL